jgi:hypothetical protein
VVDEMAGRKRAIPTGDGAPPGDPAKSNPAMFKQGGMEA